MTSPITAAISSLIEIPPPNNMAKITNSTGFALILVGMGLFVTSVLARIYYRNEDIPRRIVAHQTQLREVIVKATFPVARPIATPVASAMIHELKPQGPPRLEAAHPRSPTLQ